LHISTHRERRIRAIVKGKFEDRESLIRTIVKGFHYASNFYRFGIRAVKANFDDRESLFLASATRT